MNREDLNLPQRWQKRAIRAARPGEHRDPQVIVSMVKAIRRAVATCSRLEDDLRVLEDMKEHSDLVRRVATQTLRDVVRFESVGRRLYERLQKRVSNVPGLTGICTTLDEFQMALKGMKELADHVYLETGVKQPPPSDEEEDVENEDF